MVKDNSIVLSEGCLWKEIDDVEREKKEILTYPLDFSLVNRPHLPVPLFLSPVYIDFSSSLLSCCVFFPLRSLCPPSPLPYPHFSGHSVDFVSYPTDFPDFHLDLLLLLYPGPGSIFNSAVPLPLRHVGFDSPFSLIRAGV